MNIFINLCIIVFAFCMLCHIRKRRTRETIRLLEIWLKNEKIVRLLEKSNIHNFLCKPEKSRFWLLDNFSDYSKLLKEYVNNDKIFNKFGVLIIHEYYDNRSKNQIEESYIHFKNKIEFN